MSAEEQVAQQVSDLKIADKEEVSPTVFKSTEDFSVIHPLTDSWTLWYIKPPSGSKEDWKDLLTEVVTVSSVEEFWGAYNNLPKVSELPLRSDYALFKSNVRPEWEDVKNASGGKWVYQFRDNKAPIDDIWLNVLLGVIGGTMDTTQDPTVAREDQEINGVFVNVRRAGIRFNIWTKSKDLEKLRPIGLRFKELIKVKTTDEVEFSGHSDGKSKNKIVV
ncbi:hypothetical protein D0Z00_003386 [Geotrichum galactomycetum]|uniref:Uncharacterized protein n=1 Tax=Geotrichum galactomycetum TaxID=27317 RepID=A0ACB6V1I2_9ASCO|nr:hypothetical protein D0Z00_003386 [Geotrichum candidum]